MRGPRSRIRLLVPALFLLGAAASPWLPGAPHDGSPLVVEGIRTGIPAGSISGLPSDGFVPASGVGGSQERSESRSHGGLGARPSREGEATPLAAVFPAVRGRGDGGVRTGFGLLGLSAAPANAPPQS